MKKIKIAQIGTSKNSHGNMIWHSLLKQDDIFEVVGYAFPENEREKFPKEATAFAAACSETAKKANAMGEAHALAWENFF